MYENYGDKNFFEYGRLVEVVNDNEFNIICCTPYDDEEDKYQFAECIVDIFPLLASLYHFFCRQGFQGVFYFIGGNACVGRKFLTGQKLISF